MLQLIWEVAPLRRPTREIEGSGDDDPVPNNDNAVDNDDFKGDPDKNEDDLTEPANGGDHDHDPSGLESVQHEPSEEEGGEGDASGDGIAIDYLRNRMG